MIVLLLGLKKKTANKYDIKMWILKSIYLFQDLSSAMSDISYGAFFKILINLLLI